MGINLRYGPMDWDRKNNEYNFGGAQITNFAGSRPGKTWHCDANASYGTGDGKTWLTAFRTIQEALNVADSYDTILLAKGDFDEGAVLNITIKGLRIIGVNTSPDAWGGASIQANDGHNIMTINANDVEIGWVSFVQNDGDTYLNIDVATSVSTYRTHIHHCSFGEGTFGVRGGLAAAWDSTHCVVDNCTFLTTAIGVDLYGTFCTIKNNYFKVYSGNVGIQVTQTGGDRGWLTIQDNKINGFNSTDTGINIANAPGEDYLIMSGNVVSNCATAVTLAHYDSWYRGNDWGTTVFMRGEVYTVKNTGVLLNGATMNVFTVAGGAIEILSYFGQCTLDFGSPSTTKVGVDATADANYDADFSTGVNADGVTVGDVVTFHTTTAGEDVLDPTSNVNAGDQLSWFCPAGVILHTHTSTTGAATWYMTFRVLDAAVTVVEA